MATSSFAALLRGHRLALGLTQEELAERAGLSARAISDLERGLKQAPRPSTMRLLVLGPDDAASLLVAAVGYDQAPRTTPDKAPRRHNLPRQLSSFVGRQQELVEVQALLDTTPLLTLTGPGGVGKTRLALEVATRTAEQFADGAWLVELAPLTDLALVPQAVAAALAIPEQPGTPLVQTLVLALQSHHVLLVLDNCEHLVSACAELADHLLRSCSELRILATSREPLGLVGETVWRVPPLSLPETNRDGMVEHVARAEAARLFLDRVRAVVPAFALTERSAPGIAELCRRLDGIPLALELAAAWVPALSVEQQERPS